jgi:hypothetical protein
MKARTAAACTERKRIKADRCALTCTGQKLLSSILRGRARTEEKQAGWRRGAEIGDAELVRTTLATSSTTCGAWDRAHPRAWGCRGVGASPCGERNKNDGVLGDATEGRGGRRSDLGGEDVLVARLEEQTTGRLPRPCSGGRRGHADSMAGYWRCSGWKKARWLARGARCKDDDVLVLGGAAEQGEARDSAQERGGGSGCVRW